MQRWQVTIIIHSNMITNTKNAKYTKYSNQIYILLYFCDNFFVTFVAIVFVIFVNTISIRHTILSYLITEVSAILFKYLLSAKLHVLRFHYNLFCINDNFYTHIDMFHYSVFDFNYLLYYSICINNHIKYVFLLF